MIFTALLLLLCQDPVDQAIAANVEPSIIPGSFRFYPAQEPALSINPDTEAEYRLAMHLIDVRGNYGNGAAQLLQLVDKPDVILIPGQASWMLAQAARALTLDGRTEDAALYIPGARNGSRGTEFEKPIDDLLASFAPQSAGLDPEFLGYVKAQLIADKGPKRLFEKYGKELIPYLQFMVENSQGDFTHLDRQRALNVLVTVMDKEAAEWVKGLILAEDVLVARGLLQAFQGDANTVSHFRSLESRVLCTDVLIQLSGEAHEDLKGLILDGLIRVFWWRVFPSNICEMDESASRMGDEIRSLLEEGNRGDLSTAVEMLVQLERVYSNYPATLAGIVGNSQDLALREEMRWMLAMRGVAKELQREWALQGEPIDQLRLALMAHGTLADALLNPKIPRNEELIAWFSELRCLGEPVHTFLDLHSNLQEDREDLEVLATMADSQEPFIKYLAGYSLIDAGRQGDVIPFLENLGQAPQWASLILKRWAKGGRGDLHQVRPESLSTLGRLAKGGPVSEEAKLVLERLGHQVVTVSLWRELGLKPIHDVAMKAAKQAWDAKAIHDLLWVMLNGDLNESASHQVAYWIANDWPIQYLETIPSLEDAGRRLDWMDREEKAWEGAAHVGGPDAILEFLPALESSILQARNESPAYTSAKVFIENHPDLAVDFLARNWEDSEIVRRLIEEFGICGWFKDIQDKQASTELALSLLRGGIHKPFDNPTGHIFQQMVDQSSDSYLEILAHLLGQDNVEGNSRFMDFFIHEIAAKPHVHERFREHLLRFFEQDPDWIIVALPKFDREGMLPSLFENLLEMLEGDLTRAHRATILDFLGNSDDLRAVDVLLQYVEDPRPDIRNAAARSLQKIKARRAEMRYWDSWSLDDESKALSPTQALIKNLKDPDLEIRLVSIESLGTLGDKEALPALVELLRSDNEAIKEAARKALDRINKVEEKSDTSDIEKAKAQYRQRISNLEAELAGLKTKFTDDHPEVVAMQEKIDSVKRDLYRIEIEE